MSAALHVSCDVVCTSVIVTTPITVAKKQQQYIRTKESLTQSFLVIYVTKCMFWSGKCGLAQTSAQQNVLNKRIRFVCTHFKIVDIKTKLTIH